MDPVRRNVFMGDPAPEYQESEEQQALRESCLTQQPSPQAPLPAGGALQPLPCPADHKRSQSFLDPWRNGPSALSKSWPLFRVAQHLYGLLGLQLEARLPPEQLQRVWEARNRLRDPTDGPEVLEPKRRRIAGPEDPAASSSSSPSDDDSDPDPVRAADAPAALAVADSKAKAPAARADGLPDDLRQRLQDYVTEARTAGLTARVHAEDFLDNLVEQVLRHWPGAGAPPLRASGGALPDWTRELARALTRDPRLGLSCRQTTKILVDCFGCKVSEGTVQKWHRTDTQCEPAAAGPARAPLPEDVRERLLGCVQAIRLYAPSRPALFTSAFSDWLQERVSAFRVAEQADARASGGRARIPPWIRQLACALANHPLFGLGAPDIVTVLNDGLGLDVQQNTVSGWVRGRKEAAAKT